MKTEILRKILFQLLLLVINYCLVIITKRVRWAYYNIYGLNIQKGKFGKNFQIRRNYFSGEFLPTKTIRQNWSGSSWVGTILIYSSLFSLKSEKKNFKIKNLGFWGCFFFGLNFFDFCRFLDIEIWILNICTCSTAAWTVLCSISQFFVFFY